MPHRGYKQTEEHKRKVSESNKNKYFSKEYRKKLSKAAIGKKHSEESKLKISLNHMNFFGDKNPMFGKHHTKETLEKIKLKAKGRVTSEDTKKKISVSNIGKHIISDELRNILSKIKIGKRNPNYGKVPDIKNSWSKGTYYNSPYQGSVWLRSPWELSYAKYLDKYNKDWLYEPQTFDLKNTTYTPDFFLIKDNKFIEIKGWMKPESLEKIKKTIKEYGILIDILYSKDLKKLRCKL